MSRAIDEVIELRVGEAAPGREVVHCQAGGRGAREMGDEIEQQGLRRRSRQGHGTGLYNM